MAPAGLPHAYPFRFVDAVSLPANADFSQGRVRVRVSANARAAMGEGWQSPLLLAEVVAQAALLLQGGDPAVAQRGFLAGINDFEMERAPRAGETLEVDVKLVARFGAVLRFDGVVLSEGETVARGSVLVRQGEDSGTGPE
jgi:3-hydroxymyristoyl/3-hydroxydecanoyl-(acyl carrier protein) dehydratase